MFLKPSNSKLALTYLITNNLSIYLYQMKLHFKKSEVEIITFLPLWTISLYHFCSKRIHLMFRKIIEFVTIISRLWSDSFQSEVWRCYWNYFLYSAIYANHIKDVNHKSIPLKGFNGKRNDSENLHMKNGL